MAIYHLEAKVVSRGTGRSACAASAYLSCSEILNDYDGVRHDFTRKGGLVWEQVFLPEHAPAAWGDRSVLWNAVEEAEKTKDSRLAREFVAALPIELDRTAWRKLVTEFIRDQFVSEGMCADVAIHDPDGSPDGAFCGYNPHAHIMLTVRPLNPDGTWQYKTEKEYLCVRGGEERGLTAEEFKSAQAEGWEKQYPYKTGKKKKEYMTSSAAEARGLVRASKYPKSTKYGRQNPISERWNSEEQLVSWREAWANTVNRVLEEKGIDARIDHRSFAAQGIDEQPTIHEGVTARAMEAKGFVSDRCELNRQIRRDNALLREVKAQVQKLLKTIKDTLPAIARAMERVRMKMLILSYQGIRTRNFISRNKESLQRIRPRFNRYTEIAAKLRELLGERKTLLAEKKELPPLKIGEHRRLSQRIAALTEDMEELKSEKARILSDFDRTDDSGMKEVKKWVRDIEAELQKAEAADSRFTAELDEALAEYHDLEEKAADFDQTELWSARVNGRKPAYWYRHGRNDKIQRDAFVNASLWIFDFVYYYLIIVRLATLSAASSPPDAYPLPGTGSRSTRFLSDDPTLHLFFSGIPGTRAGKHPVPACCGNPVKTVSQEMPEVLSEHIAYS